MHAKPQKSDLMQREQVSWNRPRTAEITLFQLSSSQIGMNRFLFAATGEEDKEKKGSHLVSPSDFVDNSSPGKANPSPRLKLSKLKKEDLRSGSCLRFG